MNGLDPDRCEQYIASVPEEDRQLVRYVIDNTKYFTKQDIITECRRLLSEWLSKHTPKRLGVIVDHKKIGSKQWLYLECLDLLPPHTVISESIPSDTIDELVYIDDIIITGESFASTTSQLMETYTKEKVVDLEDGISYTQRKSGQRLIYPITVIVAVMTIDNFAQPGIEHEGCAREMTATFYNDIKLFPLTCPNPDVFKSLVEQWVNTHQSYHVISVQSGLNHWLRDILVNSIDSLYNTNDLLILSLNIADQDDEDNVEEIIIGNILKCKGKCVTVLTSTLTHKGNLSDFEPGGLENKHFKSFEIITPDSVSTSILSIPSIQIPHNFIRKYGESGYGLPYPLHLEYKIPEACVWDGILKGCTDPPDREFMKTVHNKFKELHPVIYDKCIEWSMHIEHN